MEKVVVLSLGWLRQQTRKSASIEIRVIEYAREHPETVAKDVAAALDLKLHRVRHVLNKYPAELVPRPGRGKPEGTGGRLSRRNNEIAVQVFGGKLQSDVAEEMGVSPQRISQILLRDYPGLHPPTMGELRDRRVKAEFVKNPNRPNIEIARLLHCDPHRVTEIRRGLGIPRRPCFRKGKYNSRPSTARARQACRMLLAGAGRREIAAQLGYCTSSVDILRRRWIDGQVPPSRARGGEVNRPVWDPSKEVEDA